MLDTPHPDHIVSFARTQASVLVDVQKAKGSTPRVAGTKMLVSATATLGTIGGGHLEYLAIDAARRMLAKKPGEQAAGDDTISVPLGPEIGQCCGGHVTLSLKRLTDADAQQLTAEETARRKAQPSVYVFGAGHVGRALAQALLPLPLNSLLIDGRSEELALAEGNVATALTALPEAHIRNAPEGSAFIILTHDHALDFLLASEALARTDAAYVGMIGSKTKRATFASWLESETGSREALHRLTMPIGASTLADKRPAVIAAMVAAQVMEAVGTYHASRVSA